MKRKCILMIAALWMGLLQTMAQMPTGSWRTHFAYNSVQQIAVSRHKVFGVSDGALFSVDRRDGQVEYYSRLYGLNGTSIVRIAYDGLTDKLLIAYSDGKIDLMNEDGITGIVDLYNKQLSAEKTVRDVSFNNGRAYLSCPFGIVVIDMRREEIAETYYIGPEASYVEVQSTEMLGDKLYAATPDAIYLANMKGTNLMNFEVWSTMDGVPGSKNITQLRSFAGRLLMVRDGRLYCYDGTDWKTPMGTTLVTRMTVSDGSLVIANQKGIIYKTEDGENFETITLGDYTVYEVNLLSGDYWLAAGAKGIVCCHAADLSADTYTPNGPQTNIPYRLRFGGDKLFMLQGGRDANQYNRLAHVMYYQNGSWDVITAAEINAADTAKTGGNKYSALDFVDIAIDPADNNHFYITSFGRSLYEFKDNKLFTHYTTSNTTDKTTPIEAVIPTNPCEYTRLDACVLDDDGNLWFTNTQVTHLLNVKVGDDFIGYDLGIPAVLPEFNDILVNSQKKSSKWFTCFRYSPCLVVFDDNGTLYDTSDDSVTRFTRVYDQDNNLIEPDFFLSMAQDKQGDIWVGTDKGPLVFTNTTRVFDTGYACRRVSIPRNDGSGLADYLLDGESVYAIAVDGANRKWIGTGSGLYLMSDNGMEMLAHFTTSNSPMPSNSVTSIAIHPQTGEVFVGTSGGVVSYQSDAASDEWSQYNIYAYPNPVREGYNGLVTIRGMKDNSVVRITDLAGNVVCDTRSNGSMAVWDGKNKFGSKVSSGIYLAICTSEDGEEYGRTKILVIK